MELETLPLGLSGVTSGIDRTRWRCILTVYRPGGRSKPYGLADHADGTGVAVGERRDGQIFGRNRVPAGQSRTVLAGR
jgi:hypothetical protein